jgi:hypothetical protein
MVRDCHLVFLTPHLCRDPVTALTLNNLGTLLKMEELYDESEQCLRESLKIRQFVILSFFPYSVCLCLTHTLSLSVSQ